MIQRRREINKEKIEKTHAHGEGEESGEKWGGK